MMDNGGSHGSGSQNAMTQALLMKMLIGDTEVPKQIKADSVTCGQPYKEEHGYFGVIGVRLLGPTMASPTATLRISTNGEILATPDAFEAIAKFFQKLAADPDWEKQFDEETQKGEGLDTTNMLMKAMGDAE